MRKPNAVMVQLLLTSRKFLPLVGVGRVDKLSTSVGGTRPGRRIIDSQARTGLGDLSLQLKKAGYILESARVAEVGVYQKLRFVFVLDDGKATADREAEKAFREMVQNYTWAVEVYQNPLDSDETFLSVNANGREDFFVLGRRNKVLTTSVLRLNKEGKIYRNAKEVGPTKPFFAGIRPPQKVLRKASERAHEYHGRRAAEAKNAIGGDCFRQQLQAFMARG